MKKNVSGFTLIELLITIVIIGLVFTIGYIAVLSIINSSKETKKEIFFQIFLFYLLFTFSFCFSS